MSLRSRAWPLLLLALSLWSSSAPAADLSMSDAVNMAGRQRMLTQRIIKAYCQIGLGLEPTDSRRQMDEAIARFEAQLAQLKAFAPDGTTRQALQRVESLWLPFRSLAAGPVTRDGARRLLAQDDAILLATHAVVIHLQDIAGTPQGRLVNMAGRQRMLSQRLAKLYMLRTWNIDSAAIDGEMKAAAGEFGSALSALASAPETTAAMRNRLGDVAVQWEWFQQALALGGGRGYDRLVVATSESILADMEVVTALYASGP